MEGLKFSSLLLGENQQSNHFLLLHSYLIKVDLTGLTECFWEHHTILKHQLVKTWISHNFSSNWPFFVEKNWCLETLVWTNFCNCFLWVQLLLWFTESLYQIIFVGSHTNERHKELFHCNLIEESEVTSGLPRRCEFCSFCSEHRDIEQWLIVIKKLSKLHS